MRDSERKRADKEVLNMGKLAIQSLKDRHHEEGEQETEVERN